MSRLTYFKVSFDFADDDPETSTSDFRDRLLELFEREVAEGRITNVKVVLDHSRMDSQ
jgi:hypothetical protein